jgi:hypothetical protein
LSEDRILYLVRQEGSAVYERLSKKEIDAGLASGEIAEEVCSDWVIGEDGRLVFSDSAKGYFRKK